MAYSLDNFVRATLQADVTADATTVTIAKAAEPLRDPPDATEDAPGVLVIQDAPASPTKIEILTYTGRSIEGNVVTLTGCTRGAEGTTAEAWTAGVPTFAGFTAGVLASKLDVDGTAAAATKLATVRKIAGKDFDGTQNVTISAGDVGALPSDGTAAKATKLATARKIAGKDFDGTSDISLSASDVGALPSDGTAAAATKLATARTIAGKTFDGTQNVTINAGDIGAATAAQGTKADAAFPVTGGTITGSTGFNTPGGNRSNPNYIDGGCYMTFDTGSQFRVRSGNGGSYTTKLDVTDGGAAFAAPVTINGGPSNPLEVKTSSASPWAITLTRTDLNYSSSVFLHSSGGGWEFQHGVTVRGASEFQDDVDVSGVLTVGSGKKLSKITVSASAPGTLQDGELYLQY